MTLYVSSSASKEYFPQQSFKWNCRNCEFFKKTDSYFSNFFASPYPHLTYNEDSDENVISVFSILNCSFSNKYIEFCTILRSENKKKQKSWTELENQTILNLIEQMLQK